MVDEDWAHQRAADIRKELLAVPEGDVRSAGEDLLRLAGCVAAEAACLVGSELAAAWCYALGDAMVGEERLQREGPIRP